MRWLLLMLGSLAMLGAGCRESLEDPMVWVTADTRSYHTRRCVGVPAGCRMKRLSVAQAEGLNLCSVCGTEVLPGTAEKGTPAPVPVETTPPTDPGPARSGILATPVSLEDTEVYVTASGGKYHRVNCVHLGSKQSVRLADAVRAGCTACAVCNPPRLPHATPVKTLPPPAPVRRGPQLVVP